MSFSPFRGRHAQPYLGAVPRFAADLGRAAVPLHPADDRAAYPVPVRPDLGRYEADPAVPDEDADRVGLHLRVQRHGGHLGVPAGVDQRLRVAPTSAATRSLTSMSPTTTDSTTT